MQGLFLSCEKADDCFSGAGKSVSQEYNLPEFDTIFADDNFKIILVQDTFNSLSVSGYESFVKETKFEIINNSLYLSNSHKCKFSYPKKNAVLLTLRFNKIDKIVLNASVIVNSSTALKNEKEIGLIINSKYNEVNLNLSCKTFYYWNTHLNGGKINLTGETETLKLWNASLGSVNAKNLKAFNVFIDTDSKTDCFIRPEYKLNCTIRGQGNVYCFGQPDILILDDSSSVGGKLIVTEN